MNHNPTFSSDIIMPLCLSYIVKLCSLYNFQTIQDFFMELYEYKAWSDNVQRKKNVTLLPVLM